MEECQRCHQIDENRSTIRMSCFYKMEELNIPFTKLEAIFQDAPDSYALTVCKNCRADWMQAIKTWFESPPAKKPSCGSRVWVRILGQMVEVSLDEFDKLMQERALEYVNEEKNKIKDL